MQLRILILGCLVVLFSGTLGGQTNLNAMDKTSNDSNKKEFYLNKYLILPYKKQVLVSKKVGGVNWDGFQYVVDEKINYDSTELVFIGDDAYFKEYLHGLPIDKLRLVELKGQGTSYQTVVTDGSTYYSANGETLVALKNYAPPTKTPQCWKTFEVKGDELVVNLGYTKKPILLDTTRTKEYLLDKHYQTYAVTDGNRCYVHSLVSQGTKFTELEGLRKKQLTPLSTYPEAWSIDEENKIAYLPLSRKQEEIVLYPNPVFGWIGRLFMDQKKNYFFIGRDAKVIPIKQVMTLNEQQTGFVPYVFNAEKPNYRRLNENFYILNNRLYGFNYEVSNDLSLDLDKFVKLEAGDIMTQFYTDGNILINLADNVSLKISHGKLLLHERVLSGIAIDKLRIVNASTIIGKVNILHTYHGQLERIPLAELGLKVHVITP